MRVLVTGGAGRIGRYVVERLAEEGYEIRTFDKTAKPRGSAWDHHPGDVCDITAVRRAMEDMDAVVHLAAVPNDMGDPALLFTVNVTGTWNVLLAASEAGAGKVVFFSSVNALGNFNGHREALLLPIRDDYPRHPISPYQLSKHLGEEMCRSFTDSRGIATVCLRPVWAVKPDAYAWWRERSAEQRVDWHKNDYWAYVDVRDVAEAALLSVRNESISHDSFLIAADDTHVDAPTMDLIQQHYPDTPWPAEAPLSYFASNPYRSVVDCTHAKEVLGWQPVHSWRNQSVG